MKDLQVDNHSTVSRLATTDTLYVHRAWKPPVIGWPQIVLLIAGIYNICFGAWAVFFPEHYFILSGIALPEYPALWQCIGMIVGLYGLAYLIASTDILRYWPIVFIGFMGKILGPLGYFFNVTPHSMPEAGAWLLITNDLVWWIPFFLILLKVWQSHRNGNKNIGREKELLAQFESLRSSSFERPTLLFFVRHLGCTFCRQVFKDISAERERLRGAGIQVVIVHMGPTERALKMIKSFNLDQVELIEDPRCFLYQVCGFSKASLWRAFGVRVLRKAVPALCVERCGVGYLSGDGFQLGGVIHFTNGRPNIIHEQSDVSDRFDIKSFLGREEGEARSSISTELKDPNG